MKMPSMNVLLMKNTMVFTMIKYDYEYAANAAADAFIFNLIAYTDTHLNVQMRLLIKKRIKRACFLAIKEALERQAESDDTEDAHLSFED